MIVTHLNGKAELTTSNAEDRDVRVSKQQITDDERTSEYANKRANETDEREERGIDRDISGEEEMFLE